MKLRNFRFLLLLVLFIVAFSARGQNYNMSAVSVNTCSGTFFDSGGGAGDYANNENSTMTFCSNAIGQCVRMVFTSFDTEANIDRLWIYDGPSVASPLIGVYSGNVSPGLVTSSSGCLTIRFVSDGSIRNTGWVAQISCVTCATGACATTCSGGPAPANDACTGALNLGSLPAPSACPGGIGALTTTNTTNLCATAETPYTSLLGCQPAGNMASPAADVWYRFNITGPSLNINISGGIADPNVGLYEGSSCANLTPRGCAIGSNGTLNTTFSGLAAGTYYLQVSGGSITDQCDFSLTLQNNYDCAGCVIQSTFTASPPPVNGMYPAGQTVTFCYTITDYNQTSANWLHGISPSFGPGWAPGSVTPISSTNCSGQGVWNWYNTNITSSATGNVSGPGFYYESAFGNAGGVADGNPGNNFGDNNGTNTCDWTFCWSATTLPLPLCVQGASLNITVNTLGDGESGSWGSLACTQDPVTNFFASLTCCEAPVVNVTDPLCPGQNTGSATAQGMGNGPWDYVWMNSVGLVLLTQNNIAGVSTINGLAPGSYTVRVTDNTGCTANAAFTITAPASFSAVMNTITAACFGANNGSASVVVNGGTPGYTYAWSPAGSGSAPAFLASGNYTVTVTDANGCTTVANGNVPQPAQLVLSTTTKTNVDCNGGNNGSITVAANGGTPLYAYSWSTGAAGTTINNLAAGSYTVTVTDSRGCTAFMTVGITEPTLIVLNLSSTASSCGNANGTATVGAIGGSPAYTYAWSPSGGSGTTASNLTAGGYNVTVTDSRGCTMVGNVVVSNSSGPTASIASSANVTCFGGTNGSATVNVAGGTAPVTYAWTPSGGNAATANGLAAGNYTVTVSDGSGCTSAASVIINEPTQVSVAITANVPASCSYENDGSLTAQANGGTPAYSYNWSGGSVNSFDNNLLPGTYTVTITDANGCTGQVSATVTAPAVLQPSIQSSTPVSCNSGNDGTATAQVVGGTAGYTYLWSNGSATANTTGLSVGTYTVTVTDANGCVAQTTVAIVQPTVIQLNLSSTGTTCGNNNGTATVVANGGTPGYTYAWNPTGGTGTTASGLGSGNYTVIVTDANGCTATGNVSVPSANGPVLTLNSSTDVTCPGGADGTIDISVNGGNAPYVYAWSNGGAGTQLTNLAAGTYTLTVTDANSCSAAMSVNIVQPAAFVFNNAPLTAHCGQTDGTASTVVNGGTPAYTYAWSNGSSGSATLTNVVAGTYTVTVTDANGCTAGSSQVVADALPPTITLNNILDVTCNGGADGRIRVNVAGGVAPYIVNWSNGAVGTLNSNLIAGVYTATVTDDVGCTATLSATVNEPPALQLVTASTAATCGATNGTASVVVNGGTPGYTYNWIPSGGNAANASGLGSGAYTVEVTDNNGCTSQQNITVASSNGPTVAVLIATDVTCFGGNNGDLTIAVNGGAAPYTYLWSNGGSGLQSTNLTAGNYTVTVTDDNGCTSTVVAVINEPSALVTPFTVTTAHCGQSDGGADVQVAGGVSPYSYAWSTGTSVNNVVSSLPAGAYTVTVTDANGCTANQSVNIPDLAGPVPAPDVVTDPSCNAGTNGSISISVAGGVAPYVYVWSSGSATAVNSNLTAGTYTVTVTDNFGCTGTLVSVLNEPTAIQLNFVSVNSICGNANGSATVTPSNGSAPYSYLWDNGAVTATASALSAGSYSVTVTDANGCSVNSSVIVNATGGPVLAAGPVTDVSCFGGADGSATVNVVSGNGPFTFDWLPIGGTSATATTLIAGNYKVTVTDVNGCSTAMFFDILEPTALTASNLTTPVSCFAGADGTASVDAQGGTTPYTYDWNPGGVLGASRINLTAGTYTVTVTDARGCTAITQPVVTEPTDITDVMNPADASCAGGNNGSASVVAGGGIPPYTFLWDDGSVGTQITGLTAGVYSVTITDNNGCSHAASVNVGEAAAMVLNVIGSDATCGQSNGSASVNGNGGTGVFTYQWSNGSNTNSASGLSAAVYTVIATDANGCTQSGNINIGNQGGPSIAVQNTTDVSCQSGADGSASVVVNSGNGPYTYQWLPSGGNGINASNLSAGNYTVDVTDVNGCVTSLPVVINEPAALVAALSSVDASCGLANGSAQVNMLGGTAPYTYLWSNGDLNAIANGLVTATYTVTVTDNNGCTLTDNILVDTPPALTTAAPVVTDASCNGGNDGVAEVVVNGGTLPLSYQWSNGGLAAQTTGLLAGVYTCIITDANGCTIQENVAIQEPSAINTVVNTTDATCGQSNGTAQVNTNGGTGALNVLWSTGANTNSINTLSAGSYTVTVTDANGCTAVAIAAVSNLGGPTAAVQSITDVSCNGGSNGAATVNVSAGNGPFAYQWTPSGGNAANAAGLSAGAYVLNITDANGCQSSVNVSITEPAAINLSVVTNQASCGNSNGSATVNANGGTGAYQYFWSNGDVNQQALNLSAGNYGVTVTDGNGCSSSVNVSVTQPSSLTVQSSNTPATCFNGADGSAAVNVNGGTIPYTYLWSNGNAGPQITNVTAGAYTVTVTDNNGCSFSSAINIGQASAIQSAVVTLDATCGGTNGSAQVNANGGTGALSYLWSDGQTTTLASSLGAGAYTVTVTDANGCSVAVNAAVGNQGGPQVAIQSVTPVSCNGLSDGQASVAVNAGNGPFIYSWSPSGGSAALASGLPVGNYTVAVTDANGCVTNVPVVITEPTVITAQLSAQQSTCGFANGSITTVVSGGTGPYTYTWSGSNPSTPSLNSIAAGSYALTVTDANGCVSFGLIAVPNAGGPVLAVNNVTSVTCNGSADGSAGVQIINGNGPFAYNWSPYGGNTATATGLSAGNYTVDVTDVNGCSASQVVIVQEPTSVLLQVSATPTQCNASNGTAYVQALGGTTGYTYNWSNGQSVAQATGLNGGTYTVTVTDANGCSAQSSVQVTGLPGPGISNVATTDVPCYGNAAGSAQVSFSNGTAPFNTLWSTGATGSSVSGLNAGAYSVTVTDAFGCSDARNFSIQQPAVLAVAAAPLNMVSCNGGADGSAVANVTGGISPYTYSWSSGSLNNTAVGLQAGAYTVLITDANGCTTQQSTNIIEPTALSLNQQQVSMVSCYGGNNGAASFAVNGGTTPYTYNWTSGSTSAVASALSAGTYTLIVTDDNNCLIQSTVTITQPSAIQPAAPVVSSVLCFGGNTGSAQVAASGGVSPYTYLWSNGTNGTNATGLIAGTYTVTITDDNGCTVLQNVNITQPAVLAYQSNVQPILCFGDANASIQMIPNGGVLPYSYNWSNGATSASINSLSPGVYSVTITDANNCKTDTVFSVTQPALLTAAVADANTICIGQTASLQAIVNGGTPAYSYQWSNGQQTAAASVTPVISSSYQVVITDANGCTATVTGIDVPVYPALAITLTVSDDTLCAGDATQLLASASGGNGGPYTYTWNTGQSSVSGFTDTPDSTTQFAVTLSDGCTVYSPVAQQLVVVNPLPPVVFTPVDTAGCNPVSIPFISSGYTSLTADYSWNFGDGLTGSGWNPTHIYSEEGSYDVTLEITDENGCYNSYTQTNAVTVYPIPFAFYTTQPQVVSILHPEVQFINASTGAAESHWDFGNGVTTDEWAPDWVFQDTGRYWIQLVVISSEGCIDTFLNEVVVQGETTFYIPNAFTPNNDGDNEYFTGYGIGIEKAEFFIFDRWGKMIFQSASLSNGWNGTYGNQGDPCPEGTYVYLFRVHNGEPAPKEYTGRVSLVR